MVAPISPESIPWLLRGSVRGKKTVGATDDPRRRGAGSRERTAQVCAKEVGNDSAARDRTDGTPSSGGKSVCCDKISRQKPLKEEMVSAALVPSMRVSPG